MIKPSRVLVLLGLLASGLLALGIVRGQAGMYDRDFFTFWGGGRGLLENANLYATDDWARITRAHGSVWFPNPIFIYAPITAIFFAPLAALPVELAAILWVWLSEIIIALALVIIIRDLRWTRAFVFAPFWALGLIFFLPVLLTLLMGQASALILILVVATARLWNREHWFWGGVVLGATLIKPQPIAFLLPMLALWLILNRRWRGLSGLVLSLTISALAALILYPNFIFDWQAAVQSKVGGVAARMPTIWGITADLFGNGWLTTASALGLIFVITIFCIIQIARWRATRLELIAFLATVSLIVTPYLWNYDQVLLVFPMIVALIRLEQRRRANFWSIALLPLGFCFITYIFFALAATRAQDTFSVFIPVLVLALLKSASS
jgi:alpha-1,2-mannosyltransferase